MWMFHGSILDDGVCECRLAIAAYKKYQDGEQPLLTGTSIAVCFIGHRRLLAPVGMLASCLYHAENINIAASGYLSWTRW